MDDAAIRQLLTQLAAIDRTAVRFRKGKVLDTDPLTVALGGADVPYENVRTLASTVLQVGDTVAALAWGSDLLVLAPIAADPGGWHAPVFSNGWTNLAAGDREARFYKAGGRCYLEGIMKDGTFNNAAFTLPTGYRPTFAGSSGLIFPVVSNAAFGIVAVFKDGRVVPSGGSNVYVDLSAISFRCA